jgi:hypothetical protein
MIKVGSYWKSGKSQIWKVSSSSDRVVIVFLVSAPHRTMKFVRGYGMSLFQNQFTAMTPLEIELL